MRNLGSAVRKMGSVEGKRGSSLRTDKGQSFRAVSCLMCLEEELF